MKEENEKCGEIYRRGPGKFTFSCAYCTVTFDSKSNALTHIEDHFTFEFTTQMDLKSTTGSDNFFSTLENNEIADNPENAEENTFQENFIQISPDDERGEDSKVVAHKIELQDFQFDSSCFEKEPELIFSNEENEASSSSSLKLIELNNISTVREQPNPITLHWGSINRYSYVECDICKKKCQRRAIIRHMQNLHSNPKQFACTFCEAVFPKRKQRYTHMRQHGYKKLVCHICGIQSVSNSALVCHMRVHTGEKPFECRICNRKFGRKNALTLHMRTHSGEKPYQCEICHNFFSTNSSYNAHKRRHLKIFKFKCDVCEKGFYDKVTLRFHQIVHTGERNLSCDICNRRFGLPYQLRSHMKTHTGEKPYTCRHCNECFAHYSTRTQHERVIHKELLLQY